MRKIIISGLFAIAIVGIAVAADRDRHATYSDPKAAAGAQVLCKGFYNSDDNLTACNDFCGQWKTTNEGASCDCDEGKCKADEQH